MFIFLFLSSFYNSIHFASWFEGEVFCRVCEALDLSELYILKSSPSSSLSSSPSPVTLPASIVEHDSEDVDWFFEGEEKEGILPATSNISTPCSPASSSRLSTDTQLNDGDLLRGLQHSLGVDYLLDDFRYVSNDQIGNIVRDKISLPMRLAFDVVTEERMRKEVHPLDSSVRREQKRELRIFRNSEGISHVYR